MKRIILLICIAGSITFSSAQVSTAMDFTLTDCNATTHNLYEDYLDNEEVVIMEFFMTCASCATVGQKLDPMYMDLTTEFPGMVNFFAIAYNNTYSCATINSWRNTNTPNAVALDSGAVQVSYYGGMGMPTVVVVGGSSHQVIYNSQYDGASGDTAAIHTAITNFFATAGIESITSNIKFSSYPNPATTVLNLELNVTETAQTQIEMIDMTGKVVREISNSELTSGTHKFQVETSDLPNGIYFVRINSNGKSAQYKVSVTH